MSDERMIAEIQITPRHSICKANRQEYDNEKRAKELKRRGFNEGAVAGMMDMTEGETRSLLDRHNTKEMVLDGEV